ncbi:MAG: Hsp20/alpha crystallin family protein [Acidobacteriota bacterium]
MTTNTQALRPLFRAPIGLFENMLSDVEGFWQQPLFRQVARRFDKDLAWTPTLDVYQKEGELLVKADLPGMKKEDIRISLEDGALVLQGERKEETTVEKESFYLAECSYGSFYRRLPLAFQADFAKIVAQFKDGVLEVHIPMPAVEPPKAQEIPVH